MTTTSSITDQMIDQSIARMPQIFDSHALIRDLMRHWPRAYATDLHESIGDDPIRALHSAIGTRLLSFNIIEKTRKVDSLNVRGDTTENQEWQKLVHLADIPTPQSPPPAPVGAR
jgi:hypothetical protein